MADYVPCLQKEFVKRSILPPVYEKVVVSLGDFTSCLRRDYQRYDREL